MLEFIKASWAGFSIGMTIGVVFGFVWYRYFTTMMLEIHHETGLLVKTKKVYPNEPLENS